MTKISQMLHEAIVQMFVRILRIHEHHILGFSIAIFALMIALVFALCIISLALYHSLITSGNTGLSWPAFGDSIVYACRLSY